MLVQKRSPRRERLTLLLRESVATTERVCVPKWIEGKPARTASGYAKQTATDVQPALMHTSALACMMRAASDPFIRIKGYYP